MVAGAQAVREQPRDRCLSVTERRTHEEAERAAEAAAAAKKKKTVSAVVAAVMAPATPLPNGVGVQGRGRALSNVPLTNDANSLAALQERKQSLLAAAEFRPMRSIVAVTPAGAAKFDEMPDRDDYAAGDDGEVAFAADMEKFVAENFQGKGVELRTIDQHELKTGFFGCWHAKGGHGECVEWVELDNGWELRIVERDGKPVVPRSRKHPPFPR